MLIYINTYVNINIYIIYSIIFSINTYINTKALGFFAIARQHKHLHIL